MTHDTRRRCSAGSLARHSAMCWSSSRAGTTSTTCAGMNACICEMQCARALHRSSTRLVDSPSTTSACRDARACVCARLYAPKIVGARSCVLDSPSAFPKSHGCVHRSSHAMTFTSCHCVRQSATPSPPRSLPTCVHIVALSVCTHTLLVSVCSTTKPVEPACAQLLSL